MTLILFHLPTTTYPYSASQLRSDYPATIWPAVPTADDLAHATGGEVVLVEPTEPPAHDPATQRVEDSGEPLQDGDTWRQAWRVVELTAEERDAYARSQLPPPDWSGFGRALIATGSPLAAQVDALLGQAFSLVPAAGGLLPAALLDLRNGNGPDAFVAAWTAVCARVTPSPQLLQLLAVAAAEAHLPAEFLALLQPPGGRD